MTGLLRNVIALGAALMMVATPVAAKDIGIYQTTDRKMDFQLSTCGDTDNLCVTLLDARGSANTRQTRPYIGKLVIKNAKPSGTNKWKGTMSFRQIDLKGSMVLKPGEKFTVSGCAYIVMCEEINLIPAK